MPKCKFQFGKAENNKAAFKPPFIKFFVVALMVLSQLVPSYASATTARIKDIVDIDGVRDNMLVGYGLVVGLNGTGDSLSNSPFTAKSLVGMLERLGINTRGDSLKTKNVAAVMVTATLPPFSAQGSRIDVTVSTLGDAKNLAGGTLLVTPLMGADGEVYAVGQGSLVIGGFAATGNAASVTKGVPTSGRIANGAIIEREINFELADMPNLRLNLRNPDFTTAKRIAEVINNELKGDVAVANDRSNVTIQIKDKNKDKLVSLITRIEQLQVTPDEVAKVVIDEQSGVIVMGDNVRISRVAIAQGNLTVRITETPQVSQPGPLSNGTTQTVDRTDIDVSEGDGKKLAVFSPGVTLQELVHSLNALGIGPRDMITILQSIKAAGALQADIEVI
ncbi:MAG: flagellar basal body P-ring protein FlgI [Alphaproteobacteria bacterium]|nr:flagellar basal body P-ring protein FlgI [Alphaproteobacteria bacterium]